MVIFLICIFLQKDSYWKYLALFLFQQINKSSFLFYKQRDFSRLYHFKLKFC